MKFTQRTRGFVQAIAVVLSVAVPAMLAISAADARVGGGGSSGSRGSRTYSAPPQHLHRAERGATDEPHHDPAG